MENISDLRKQFEAANSERKELLAKGEGMKQEDGLRLEALVDQMEQIRGQMERGQGIQQARLRGDQLEQWASASAGAPALPSNVTGLPRVLPDGTPAPAQVLGLTPAGEETLEITAKGIEVVNTGAGIMDKRQWETIHKPAYAASFWRNAKVGWHNLSNSEQAVLQEGIDPDGGFLVPDQLLNRIVAKKPTPTRVAGLVSQFSTIRDALALPKVVYATDDIYTTGMRATWTGEIPASATVHRATQPQFGQIRIPIYTVMISIAVTNDLLEDSIVMLQEWLSDKFFETIELLKDNMVLNGTGVSQPSGILRNPGGTDEPATVALGAASTLTADGIQSLGWSLPEQYDENGRFVFNKTNTGQALAKLKDGDGRYLWGMGTQDSGLSPAIKGRELLGYPVVFSGFAPNVDTNTYPIVFGDLRGYYLVTRVGFSVQVLRELYAETNQVLLLGRVRFGGAVAEPWRLRIGKVAAS